MTLGIFKTKSVSKVSSVFALSNLVIFSCFLLMSQPSHSAGLQGVVVDVKKNPPAPRWMFDEKGDVRNRGTARILEKIKKQQITKKFSTCLQQSRQLPSSDGRFGGWALVAELNCARMGVESQSVSIGQLFETINRAKNRSSYFIKGAHKEVLRSEYVEARLLLAQKDQKRRRQRSWQSLDALFEVEEWLQDDQRVRLLSLATDLSFIEQKMSAARRFVLMNLDIGETEELKEKLSSIDKAIAAENKSSSGETKIELAAKVKNQPELEAQVAEEKLYESVQSLLKGGDLLSATEDAVKLIKDFPGGRRSEWASEQILSAYLKVDSGKSESYFSEQSRMLRAMGKVDGLRLHKWASKLFDRGRYFASKELAKKAVEKLGPASRTRKVMMLAGEAALATGKVREAADLFAKVAQKHSGSSHALKATFRAGLAHFRLQEYSKAVSFFERMLVINDGSSLELSSRYWLWRSLQKMKSNKAEAARRGLVRTFPLTYYGLRGAAEAEGNQIQLAKEDLRVRKVKIWMTDSQKNSWARFNALLRAGWLDEAQAELAYLGPFYSKEIQTVMSKVWGAALGYRKAISLARESIDMTQRLKDRSYVNLAYPQEFQNLIDKNGEKNGLSTTLLQSLIRQESAYEVKAVSRSNAKGLMQLIPPTAKEMAQRLKVKDFSVDDLYDPQVNIRFGAYYLSLMMKSFKQHVPLALAAYNAGPTRLRRWLSGRDLVKQLTSEMSSTVESEIWLDEMPWSETRHYVKSILRNYIVYKMLDDGQAKLADPIWK